MTANTAHSELTSADAAALAGEVGSEIAEHLTHENMVELAEMWLLIGEQHKVVMHAFKRIEAMEAEIARLRAANDAREGDGK